MQNSKWIAIAIETELGERSHSLCGKGSAIQSEKGKRRLVKQVEEVLNSSKDLSEHQPPTPTPLTHTVGS